MELYNHEKNDFVAISLKNCYFVLKSPLNSGFRVVKDLDTISFKNPLIKNFSKLTYRERVYFHKNVESFLMKLFPTM